MYWGIWISEYIRRTEFFVGLFKYSFGKFLNTCTEIWCRISLDFHTTRHILSAFYRFCCQLLVELSFLSVSFPILSFSNTWMLFIFKFLKLTLFFSTWTSENEITRSSSYFYRFQTRLLVLFQPYKVCALFPFRCLDQNENPNNIEITFSASPLPVLLPLLPNIKRLMNQVHTV